MIFLGIKLWLVRSSSKKSWISEQVSMISVIDDDRSVREAVKNLIRSLGYEAVTFASAEETLAPVALMIQNALLPTFRCPAG
jgi:FixJ family two-component response regulator